MGEQAPVSLWQPQVDLVLGTAIARGQGAGCERQQAGEGFVGGKTSCGCSVPLRYGVWAEFLKWRKNRQDIQGMGVREAQLNVGRCLLASHKAVGELFTARPFGSSHEKM